MNTECGQYRNLIPRALLGDAGPAELERLNAHLAQCPECKQEEQLYSSTLGQLHSADDAPVPRHFFVYDQARRESPWRLFRNMSLAWQGTAAAFAAAVLLLGVFTAARLQVRVENGAMILSFGGTRPATSTPQPAPALDTRALEARILQVAEERTRREVFDWVRTLRDEVTRDSQRMNDQQRVLFRTALDNLQKRMTDAISETAQNQEARTDKALAGLYATVNLQRERDVSAFNERITQVTLNNETKSNQTDAILETLLQAAELRLRN